MFQIEVIPASSGITNLLPTGSGEWRRPWYPTPVLLPGESHGRRSLVGCSPWGRKESDTSERLQFHFSLSCIGEGNGNPLQCSCLENPRDGGAWWAAVSGVAQSWTRLKWLSSSRVRRDCFVLMNFHFLLVSLQLLHRVWNLWQSRLEQREEREQLPFLRAAWDHSR